jgi:HEAT repeats
MPRRAALMQILILLAAVHTPSKEVQANEPFKLNPIAGLSRTKQQKTRSLARRYHQQQARLMTLPDSAKLIKLPKALATFCTAADLVAITFSEDNHLSQAAFNLLQSSFNSKLGLREVQRLQRHITARDRKASWKALWTAGVLGPNARLGLPALSKLLERSRDPFVQVHAAGALIKSKLPEGKQRRRAVLVLLRSLGNRDDTAREAYNYMPRLKPWMVQWLYERLSKASDKSPLWHHGLACLTSRAKGPRGPLRKLYVRALGHPEVAVRISAVNGLRALGLTAADAAICRKIQQDRDPNVRRMIVAALDEAKAAWTAPLLMACLQDSFLDNVRDCAHSLTVLGHRPAVPRLMALLIRASRAKSKAKSKAAAVHDAHRAAGQAVVKLAKLKGFDFEPKYDVRGNRHMHATVVVNRDAHYRREQRRLLKWWSRAGKRRRWSAASR